MKPHLWLLAVALLAIPVTLWQQEASSSAPDAAPPRGDIAAQSAHRFLGAGSCAAAACHNGYSTTSHDRREYTTWITKKDPHANAHAVLYNELSTQIQKNRNTKTFAYNEQRCLICHVAQDYDEKHLSPEAKYFKNDGVSCESCHGGARDWINEHHLSAWQFKTTSQKTEKGMNDTQSLAGRARVCASCHVGTAGKDVDHDLIAAGHPRLNFEFSAFHAALPRHWPDAKDRDPSQPRRGGPDFEARAWAIGQLVTAETSLELLSARANPKTEVWPEFAEHDCAACHHDLQWFSPRRSKENYGKRKPGAFPWGNYVAMIPQVLETIKTDSDAKTLEKFNSSLDMIRFGLDNRKPSTPKEQKPNRQELSDHAKQAAKVLRAWQQRLENKPYDRAAVGKLLDSLYAQRPAKVTAPTDVSAQLHLGMAALSLAARDMKLKAPASGLRYPFERFEPAAFSKRMKATHVP